MSTDFKAKEVALAENTSYKLYLKKIAKNKKKIKMHIYNLIYCCQLSRSFLSVLSNKKITMSLDKISF